MTRVRVGIFILTLVVVGVIGVIASFYARGYKFDQKSLKFLPNGLLVANSDPNGAQIFIDGELRSATNATVSLSPGVYDVTLRKEGFIPWNKRITIEKEIVSQIDETLFPSAPSVSAITFSGVLKAQVSPDLTKIAYGVPLSKDDGDKAGLWVLETVNLPLGFNREPRRITDGDIKDAVWLWSPDSRQILLTTKTGSFLLDSNTFTSQSQLVNIATNIPKILADWQDKETQKLTSQLSRLPSQLNYIFTAKVKSIDFSPDENKILYTASQSATIPSGLLPSLPGSSTQKESRDIIPNHKYVFDIKEDRNFEVASTDTQLYWFATSKHLVEPDKDKIVIFDYDGTNRQTVYAGSYVFPYAFPSPNTNRIYILTNLGATTSALNLYSLNLK